MDRSLVLCLLAAHLVVGFVAGWIAGCVRGSRRSMPTESEPCTSGIVDELFADVARHSADLRVFSGELRGAGSAPPHLPPGRIEQVRQLSLRTEERLRSGAERLSRGPVAKGSAVGRLLVCVSEHCGKVHEFCTVLRSNLDKRIPGDVTEVLAAAVAELLESNGRLESELQEARRTIAETESKLRSAEREARVDPLTKLANRRAFDERLAACHSRLERGHEIYSLALFDLDNFKNLNDQYGHEAGDAALAVFGRVLAESVRSYDHAARLGGEEFAVLLPRTGLCDARVVAERCRRRIEQASVRRGEHQIRFTVSAGVALARPDETTAELLIRADAALYAAKSSGRNRVCLEETTGHCAIESTELITA